MMHIVLGLNIVCAAIVVIWVNAAFLSLGGFATAQVFAQLLAHTLDSLRAIFVLNRSQVLLMVHAKFSHLASVVAHVRVCLLAVLAHGLWVSQGLWRLLDFRPVIAINWSGFWDQVLNVDLHFLIASGCVDRIVMVWSDPWESAFVEGAILGAGCCSDLEKFREAWTVTGNMIALNDSRCFPAILEIPGVAVCDKGSLSLLLLTAGAIFLAAPKAILCIRVGEVIMRHGLNLKE